MCLGAAFTTKVGRVVFGLESPTDGGAAAFADWDARRDRDGMPSYAAPVVDGGVRRRESAELFGRYAETTDLAWVRTWAADLADLGRR